MIDIDRQQLGKDAEHEAERFLEKKGLILITKNYHCYYGEIDLIMRDKEDIVFIEVRSRARTDFGNALESVNKRKIKKLIKTAMHFLQRRNWFYTVTSRFDIIAIHPINGKMQLEWFKNAFSVEHG